MPSLQYHSKHRHATWLELFFDLVFVAGIGVSTHHLAHVHDGHLDYGHAGLFLLELIPVWWIWATHTLHANRFDTDGKGHRVASLTIMFLMVTMTGFFGSGLSVGLVGFYVAIRLILAGMYFGARRHDATLAGSLGVVVAIGAAVAAASLLFDGAVRIAVFFGGIALEMLLTMVVSTRKSSMPIHRPHLVERIGLLSIILLGETVISLVAGLRGIAWNPYNISAALTGFITLVSIWWIYFDSFDRLERTTRLEHGFSLLYSHAFFVIGLGMLASVVGHAIRAELAMPDFRILAIAGTTLFYVGKQVSYFYLLPPYRKNILINSAVCVAITTASTFLPRVEYALAGMTVALIFYSVSNFRWTLTKDASAFLTPEHD